MTGEQEFAWAFHEEAYKQAMQLVAEISEFRSLHAEKPSELNIQKQRLQDAGSRLDEIIMELMKDASVPKQMIDEIKACRDAAELVEPTQPQVVNASTAELSQQPAKQTVNVQFVVVTAPALPSTPKPDPAREETVVEQARSPGSPSAQAAPTEQMQAASTADQSPSPEQVQTAPAAWVEPMQVVQTAVEAPQSESGQTASADALVLPDWELVKPKKFHGYNLPVYKMLQAAHRDGRARPTARDVLEEFSKNKPLQVAQVLSDGLDYYDANGNTKAASMNAIRNCIGRMTKRSLE